MSEYIPYPLSATDVPIDISFVFDGEKPAGKHGFLKAKGADFVFEDGTKVRFWGTCLNGAANFPEHDHAQKLARRLAKLGINFVRLHQMDAEYCIPNIFQYSRGPLLKTTRKLDEESLDRLDYLISCLKKEGIYIMMDLLVSRQFKEGDGVEAAGQLSNGGKPYCMFNPKLIALQKEYIQQLFTHVNPYTGLAYTDEPAIVLTDILNECETFQTPIDVEPYATEFRQLFRSYLDSQGICYDAENCDLLAEDVPLLSFKIQTESTYYRQMRDYLKGLGVKIPITGTNYTRHGGMFASNEDMDYRDNHVYFHRVFQWGERKKSTLSFALTQRGDSGLVDLLHMRSLDKPFFVSEWDMIWPNPYRAESPLFMAAVGALQGFGGIAIHTYSYNARQNDSRILGKESYGDAYGGVPYREGPFSAWNDPAKFGLFYHSALLMRRGDVSESQKSIAIQIDPLRSKAKPDWMADVPDPLNWYMKPRFDQMAPCYYCLGEISKTGTCLTPPENADTVYTQPQWPIDVNNHEIRSDNGQMGRNWDKNLGWIDTEKTKCVYGFLAKNGGQTLTDLEVTCKTDFAVIALSALDDAPITSSGNLLLTTVGRARNRGGKFDGDTLVAWGEGPVEVESIQATLRIRTENSKLKVFSITPEGMIQGTVPSEYCDGVLTVTLGETWRSMYYLIQES